MHSAGSRLSEVVAVADLADDREDDVIGHLVRGERNGAWFRGTVRIDAPREVTCAVQGDALSCL